MGRHILAIVAVVLLAGGSASAHHAYTAYVTDHRISIEGDLQEIQWANPHVIMKIRVSDSTVYTVTWQPARWIQNWTNATATTFKIGDHLIVNGAPSRNPALHELASLREVRRPRDGWTWKFDN